MDVQVLERRFTEIGALAKVRDPVRGAEGFRIDVRGEVFQLHCAGRENRTDVEVVDVDRPGRHLLLLVREDGLKSKFLCGFDERHWFVAAVPEQARGVTGVATAKLALQPSIVQEAIDRAKPKDRFRRRNAAYVRQGEWFFVPEPDLDVSRGIVHRREPLARDGGTAHTLELAFRRGGEPVWTRGSHVLGEAEHRALPERQRRGGRWRRGVRDPELYARGAVRHPDHATIVLHDWHRVVMNTERDARAMRHVAFID